MAHMVKNLPAVLETQIRSLGWEDPLEKGQGSPLQHSCLENLMDRGAWRASPPGRQRVRYECAVDTFSSSLLVSEK